MEASGQRSSIELALTVLRRGTGIKYHEELEERRQAIKGLEAMLAREWVGLTEEEVSEIIDREIGFNSCYGPEESFARAIETKLKEKNT